MDPLTWRTLAPQQPRLLGYLPHPFLNGDFWRFLDVEPETQTRSSH
jgi:hypothetical protein